MGRVGARPLHGVHVSLYTSRNQGGGASLRSQLIQKRPDLKIPTKVWAMSAARRDSLRALCVQKICFQT